MGLFDIFRKKDIKVENKQSNESATKNDSLTNFDYFYLYGLTDNPYRQSKDIKEFNNLYNKLIGDKGGIIIGSSFHPYQLVNPKGTTAWQAAYLQLYVNEKKDEAFNAIINENGQFLVDPSSAFKDINVWPDTRLTFDENPIFSKYVPFVIPFLVYKSNTQTQWDLDLNVEIALKGHASEFVNTITNSIRFFMPEPSFILGFDEFYEQNPSSVIDNFINCKKLIEQ